MPSSRAIRLVAWMEAAKGAVVLLAGTGCLALIHRDVHQLAAQWIAHAHLNPASKYPQVFLDAAAQINDARLWLFALGALVYAGVRLVEAYGLYQRKAWAEVLAASSGAIYVPFELLELVRQPSGITLSLLVLNVAVVALMVHALLARRKAQAAPALHHVSGGAP